MKVNLFVLSTILGTKEYLSALESLEVPKERPVATSVFSREQINVCIVDRNSPEGLTEKIKELMPSVLVVSDESYFPSVKTGLNPLPAYCSNIENRKPFYSEIYRKKGRKNRN